MKPTRIILSLSILFLTALSVKAQDCNCPEEVLGNATKLTVIGVNDYANFLHVKGLKKYSNINYIGLDSNTSEIRGYTLRNNGKHVILFATYGRDGDLIRGRLIAKNSPMPKVIRDYLVTDNYKDWTMTSNKILVRDFNAEKTEYEVKIQRDKMKQTLFFDHFGNRIKKLTRI
jgi:hypothetical protein